jgi:eukaryotic-like serine/threonine-protein kinase
VMELLEGANLEELITAHIRLTPDETIWVLRGVGKALDVAHQKGIVHRDLKPENVYISFDDEGEPVPKVCDFGIAKLAGDAAVGLMSTGALGTQTGITVGTPMYMSPEQARSTNEIGVESDQWAVGLIAFKMLTGREYFSTARSTTELLLKIVNDPLDPPTQRLSTLPPAFDAWFFKSCARDPKGRWASAGEQVSALTEVLSVTTPRPPAIPKSERAIATAETVSVESVSPQARQATTAAPASRTMAEPMTAAPVRRSSRAPVFIAVAMLGFFAVAGGVFFVARKPAVSAQPTIPEKPVEKPVVEKPIEKPIAEPPAVTGTATASVSATVTAPKPTAIATSTAKSGKVPIVPSATASTLPKSQKLAKGAACTRSSECASGFCVSEECQ